MEAYRLLVTLLLSAAVLGSALDGGHTPEVGQFAEHGGCFTGFEPGRQ